MLHLPSDRFAPEMECSPYCRDHSISGAKCLLAGRDVSRCLYTSGEILLNQAASLPPFWNSLLVGENAHWLPTPWYRCPWEACTREERKDGTMFHLCDGCRQILAYWMSWIATAWPMIRGDFQEREEVEEPEERTIHTTRKVPGQEVAYPLLRVEMTEVEIEGVRRLPPRLLGPTSMQALERSRKWPPQRP